MSGLITEDGKNGSSRIGGWAATKYHGLVELRRSYRNKEQNTYAQVLISVTKDGVMFSTNGKAWFDPNGLTELSDVINYVQEELL